MKNLKKIMYFTLGFAIAFMTITMSTVGAQISEGINRVFITNNMRNPIPVTVKETLKIEGEVKIDGKPEMKLDNDSKIKIESVEKPINVRLERTEAMPETGIFEKGEKYNISFDGKITYLCEIDKVKGTWIKCERKQREGEIIGWINTVRLTRVTEF